MTNDPFADLKNLLEALPEADSCARKAAVSATDTLSNATGDGGSLAEYYRWLATWQGNKVAKISEAHICLFAASHVHGMAVKDLQTILEAATRGQAPINKLCMDHGIGLRVLELALEIPLKSPTDKPLFDARDTMAGIAFGMEAAASGGHLLALGDLAYGTEVGSLAIVTAIHGETPEHWGGDKIHGGYLVLTKAALEANKDSIDTALDAMMSMGGREIATMVGAIIAARMEQIPVLLDGWAALAAATVLHSLSPSALDHCAAASAASVGQARAWSAIGLKPVVSLDMDMGQGAGAAIAIGTLHSAVGLYGS